jgi:RNA polymerase sigma factor (sigma-70 family)
MRYDTDADDARHLDDGRIDILLAKYDDAIVGRCIASLRGAPDAEDVAQNVKLRLLREFHAGKRYVALPYRVVVHQVISWTIGDYFGQRPTDSPLPEGWEPSVADGAEAVDSRYHLMGLFADLPERSRRVLELFYVLGLQHDQIARRLGITRNNVDQALYRGHQRLRETLSGG